MRQPVIFGDSLALESGALLHASDTVFIRRVIEVTRKHLAEPEFSTASLSSELGYSRMHVNRRLRAALGCSTRGLIRLIRMRCALQLLEQNELTVSGVARCVGFRSASHFSYVFKCTWGLSPTHLRRATALTSR